jgi:hypothetical protein
VAYIYQADVWCDDCGRAICRRLKRAALAPENPGDEWSFDSDEYPKRAGDDEEADTPQHCASGEECINALTLPDGGKVGLLFGELTAVGVEYVKEAIAEAEEGFGSKQVTDLWQQHYRDKGYSV